MATAHVLDLESQILHAAARPDRDAEDLYDLLVEGVSWPKLIWLAQRERAEHTLFRRLGEVQALDLPEEATQLRTVTMVSDFRMQHLQTQLLACVKLLREHGIETLLLKGGGLALTVYGSFAARPMIDIDVLVPSDRAREAWNILRESGWNPVEDNLEKERFREEHHHHLPHLLEPSGTGAVIEVHTALFVSDAPFALSPEDVWAEAVRSEFDGIPILVPSVRHQIIHLGIHFAWSHVMASGSWRTFRDLRHVLDAHEVDWDAVVEEAIRTRAASSVFWTLHLANELQGLGVDPGVLERLRPPLGARALGRLTRALSATLSPLNPNACPSVGAFRMLWKRAIQPEWSGHTGPMPWNITEEEDQVVGRDSGTRASPIEHLKRLPAWLRFTRAAIMGG